MCPIMLWCTNSSLYRIFQMFYDDNPFNNAIRHEPDERQRKAKEKGIKKKGGGGGAKRNNQISLLGRWRLGAVAFLLRQMKPLSYSYDHKIDILENERSLISRLSCPSYATRGPCVGSNIAL